MGPHVSAEVVVMARAEMGSPVGFYQRQLGKWTVIREGG